MEDVELGLAEKTAPIGDEEAQSQGKATLISRYVQILRIHVLFPRVHLRYNTGRTVRTSS